MKDKNCLVPIPWETRNLGLESFKVSDEFIENPDTGRLRESVAGAVKKYGRIFIQVRVPKDNIEASPVLAQNGFYFIEAIFTPYTAFKNNAVLRRFGENRAEFIPRRIKADVLGIRRLDKDDGASCAHVKNIARESFWWDRFHMDPNCPEEVSKDRLCHFMDDLIGEDGSVLDILEYGGKDIAFMARRGEDLVMAGFERQYEISGLADFFWLSVLETMAGEGHKKAETLIYHNNTSVLNLYARLGFNFRNPCATFHFWSAAQSRQS